MKRQLIVISGVSGAGKTTASNILEDMGYRCIDQFPVELLEDLTELLEKNDSPDYEKVAITVPLSELKRFEILIDNINLKPIFIIIDASLDSIINRYKFSRRVHPLLMSNKANSLIEAIEIEKSIVETYKNRNCHIIDTTNLSLKAHRERIEEIIANPEVVNLTISFESFGYKYGVPDDADIVLDTRVLVNPYYDDKLREKTGLDKKVQDYVLKDEGTLEYIQKVIEYLDYVFSIYNKEDKRHISVCIGCTGGQHRSVTITEYLYKHYKKKYVCYITHRQLIK